MKRLEYQVSFTTPTFLGNADQQAQWRTPPFKALIRQWWRVVKAPQVRFNVDALRAEENILFGAASDDGKVKSHRSLVRLRLDSWKNGDCRTMEDSGRVCHPEVQRGGPACPSGQGRMIGANLYLGYGPVGVNGLARPPAIAPSKGQKLQIMFPNDCQNELCAAMQLAAWFGTLGSRSRNGWGALQMAHDHLKPLTRSNLEELNVTKQLSECLREEWPHAIGSDNNGPLVWRTQVTGDWRAAMKELARLKIAFRTQFVFNNGGQNAAFDRRHVLAYPVTKHNPPVWGGQERLANQIRFKLAKASNGKLEGIIVHLPCKVPGELVKKLSPRDQKFIHDNELAIWQAVHSVLDNQATRLV